VRARQKKSSELGARKKSIFEKPGICVYEPAVCAISQAADKQEAAALMECGMLGVQRAAD
jgi:hypothetical protein